MKKIKDILKMNILAGKASPAPPVGPALGLRGLNMMSFCKEFNDLTKNYHSDIVIPTKIISYEDKSMSIELLSPSNTFLLKKICYINKGSLSNNVVISPKTIYHVALMKQKDYPHLDVISICKSIISSAKTLGIQVKH